MSISRYQGAADGRPRFLTTGGVYTADVRDERLAGACHVHFVRSPGVIAAFSGADLADLPVLGPPIPGTMNAQMSHWLLARDVVRWLGEPGRDGAGLPAGDPAGLRGLPEVRRVPAVPDHLDGAGAVRHRSRRGGGHIGGDQHHAGRRLPWRGPSTTPAPSSTLIAEGQRHDGIAQGAAQAFCEEVVYDADGNPLTSSFADYAVLPATEVPSFELAQMQAPTSYNPLGAKGIREAGPIGSTPAVQNAIIDAVAHLGARHIDMPAMPATPATPQRVWQALQSAAAQG